MKFRNIDVNGDWDFGRGVNDYTTKNSAIGLNIKTRIQSWVNDCFFDMPAGIDWANRLGSKNQQELLEQDIRVIILQSQDVTGINSFTTTLEGRKFSTFFDISTIYTQSFIDEIEVAI